MRYTNYQNLTITYPEAVVWLGDVNTVTVSSSIGTDQVGAEIIIRHPNGSSSRTITYLSEMNRLMFVLDDALTALYDENIGQYTVQCNIYIAKHLETTVTFSFQLLDGKSFTNRSHGISRTIYLYSLEEASKINIYSPSDGYLSAGSTQYDVTEGMNSFNLGWLVSGDGTYTVCLGDGETELMVVISGDFPINPTTQELYYTYTGGMNGSKSSVKGGDIWKGEENTFPICHRIVMDTSCSGKDFIELRYTDCDGCIRYLGGKLLTEANKSSGDAYTRNDGNNSFRNIPRRHMTSNSRTIKVGFYDIATDAYPQDIKFSDEVWMKNYNGEWWPVVVASDTISVNGNDDTQDFELDIIISEVL